MVGSIFLYWLNWWTRIYLTLLVSYLIKIQTTEKYCRIDDFDCGVQLWIALAILKKKLSSTFSHGRVPSCIIAYCIISLEKQKQDLFVSGNPFIKQVEQQYIKPMISILKWETKLWRIIQNLNPPDGRFDRRAQDNLNHSPFVAYR